MLKGNVAEGFPKGELAGGVLPKGRVVDEVLPKGRGIDGVYLKRFVEVELEGDWKIEEEKELKPEEALVWGLKLKGLGVEEGKRGFA